MDDLIARLEAAQTGNGELSWAVAEALGWTSYWSGQTVYLPPGEIEGSRKGCADPPRFTTSVDAAMTLLPGSGMNRCWGISENPDRDRSGPCCTIMLHTPAIEAIEVFAPTCALAVCIAALKARNAVKD